MTSFNYQNITAGAPTTTTLKTGAGTLHSVIINKTTASAIIAIYDGISVAAGTLIGTITQPGTLINSQEVLTYDVAFQKGLTIVTTTAQDITVSFN